MCHYCDYHDAGADDVPRVQVRRPAVQRPGHAEARGGSAGPVSGPRRACGWTPTACAARQPRAGAGRVSRRPGADSAGHADDRQGARFSERDAGGRDQRRYGAAPARLPRGGADVSTGDASGRPDGPRADRAAACSCRRSAPTRRRSWRRCGTTTRRSRATELPHREALGYPPFASMVRIVIRGASEADDAERWPTRLAAGCGAKRDRDGGPRARARRRRR